MSTVGPSYETDMTAKYKLTWASRTAQGANQKSAAVRIVKHDIIVVNIQHLALQCPSGGL
jgi:hypothetical protein